MIDDVVYIAKKDNNMRVRIFIKDNCLNCPPAKELGAELERAGINVEYHDILEVNGLAKSLWYTVLSTPAIIVTDGDAELHSWRGFVPDINEVLKILNSYSFKKKEKNTGRSV